MKTRKEIGNIGGRRLAALILTAAAMVCGSYASAADGCYDSRDSAYICSHEPYETIVYPECKSYSWTPLLDKEVFQVGYEDGGMTIWHYPSVFATKTTLTGTYNDMAGSCVYAGNPEVASDPQYICTTPKPTTSAEVCCGT